MIKCSFRSFFSHIDHNKHHAVKLHSTCNVHAIECAFYLLFRYFNDYKESPRQGKKLKKCLRFSLSHINVKFN